MHSVLSIYQNSLKVKFQQVRVRKEDQDALRFRWWSDNYTEPPDVYVMGVLQNFIWIDARR